MITTYQTSIGPITINSEWPALHSLFRTRAYQTESEQPGITITTQLVGSVDGVRALTACSPQDPAADPRYIQVLEGVCCFGSNRTVHIIIPHNSYTAGIVLDWLWLALPIFFAPPGYEALHAGAVVDANDNAIVICGESSSGKTTVVQALLNTGKHLLGDDLVMVNPTTRQVLGWGTTLHLTVEDAQDRGVDTTTLDFHGKVRIVVPCAAHPQASIHHLLILDDSPQTYHHAGDGFDTSWIPQNPEMAAFLGTGVCLGKKPLQDRLWAEFAPEDEGLVIATPFAGKSDVLAAWLDALVGVGIPAKATLFWLLNTSNPEFETRLREAVVRFPANRVIIEKDCHVVGPKNTQVAYLWQQIRSRLPETTTKVFCLEDDVVLQPGAITRLLQHQQNHPEALLGIPVPYRYGTGELELMAWTIETNKTGGPITGAPHGIGLSPVDGISFAATLWSRELFDSISLEPVPERLSLIGYDQQACLEVTRLGYPILVDWNEEAFHYQMLQRTLVKIEAPKMIIQVVGSGSWLENGPGWKILAAVSDINQRDPQADYLLFCSPDQTIPTTYIAEALQQFTEQNVGWVVGPARRGSNLVPEGGAWLVRSKGIARAGFLPTPETAITYLANNSWIKGTVQHSFCTNTIIYRPPTPDPSRALAPYGVLFTNRNPYSGPQAGFGGDMVHLEGYIESLRILGVVADFRDYIFKDYKPWNILHLFHTQMFWSHEVVVRPLPPLIISAITHGRAKADSVLPTVNKAQYVLCYSQSEVDYYRSLGVPSEKLQIVPMGISPDFYAPVVQQYTIPRVFMAGRYCEYKNQHTVLQACKKLDVPVTFAGPAPNSDCLAYKARLIEMAKDWAGAAVLDLLHGRDLLTKYDEALVCVNAASFEPYGLVTLEALARGANIVHSRNSWAAEEFGSVGTLCDPSSIQDITSAIDTELRKPRGWADYQPLTWLHATTPLLEIYAKML